MVFSPSWLDVTPDTFLRASEEGAHLGEEARSESERERASKASEALEYARMNEGASQANASRALRSSEDALGAKADADQTAFARAEQGKKDNLASTGQSNQFALDSMKLGEPDYFQTPRGGIYSINPMTGAMTEDRAQDPVVPKTPTGETFDERKLLQTRAALIHQLETAKTPQQVQAAMAMLQKFDNPPPPLSPDQQGALGRIDRTWKAPGFDFGSPQAKALIQERTDIEDGSLGGNQNPLNAPAAQSQGVRVRNKTTGQMGTQMPDGSIVPDPAAEVQ